MASSSSEHPPLTDKDTLFVGRLVYDVMVYTLPICGFPETMLPTTDCDENVYNRANLVKTAGALTLRAALTMRDKWKRLFKSRLKSSGFNEHEVANLMGQILICCPLIRERAEHSVQVEEFLAVCNEMMLFCHHESIVIDPVILIKSTATYIIFTRSPNENISKAIEELIHPISDMYNSTRWLIDFIAKFAIPYGSRDDVSDIFTQHYDQIKNVSQGPYPVEKSVLQLKDHLGFLPHDAFSAIALEGSRTVPENLQLPSGSTLPGDRESPEPPKLPDSSKKR